MNDHTHLCEAGKKAMEEVEHLLQCKGYPTGSRAISPEHTAEVSDYDYLVYVPSYGDSTDDLLADAGWRYCPIYTRKGASYYRKVDGHTINAIIVTCREEYDRWAHATQEGSRLKLRTRKERIDLFRDIVDRDSLPEIDRETVNE